MKAILIGLLFGMFVVLPVSATTFEVDKSTYTQGDTIVLSGTVSPVEPGTSITARILDPPKSGMIAIAVIIPDADGSFSETFKADGILWRLEGTYTMKLLYNMESFETTFDFVFAAPEPESNPEPAPVSEPESKPESKEPKPESKESKPEPKPESKPASKESDPESKPKQESAPESETSPASKDREPKTHIPGFPAQDRSPQYYMDKYDTEADYKAWFDSQFSDMTVESVVGYDQTHIGGFPAPDRSPQYYMDKYDTEADYKAWFDSQFPDETIHQILGFPEPVTLPDWIKNNARWWSMGQISDDDFISGIKFMLENGIIVIPNLPDSQESQNDAIPSWVRDGANWWSADKISEDEFVGMIKYLVESGIIAV